MHVFGPRVAQSSLWPLCNFLVYCFDSRAPLEPLGPLRGSSGTFGPPGAFPALRLSWLAHGELENLETSLTICVDDNVIYCYIGNLGHNNVEVVGPKLGNLLRVHYRDASVVRSHFLIDNNLERCENLVDVELLDSMTVGTPGRHYLFLNAVTWALWEPWGPIEGSHNRMSEVNGLVTDFPGEGIRVMTCVLIEVSGADSLSCRQRTEISRTPRLQAGEHGHRHVDACACFGCSPPPFPFAYFQARALLSGSPPGWLRCVGFSIPSRLSVSFVQCLVHGCLCVPPRWPRCVCTGSPPSWLRFVFPCLFVGLSLAPILSLEPCFSASLALLLAQENQAQTSKE